MMKINDLGTTYRSYFHMEDKMKEISIYIHIPFCIRKCYYCDFTSFSNLNEKIPLYMNSLKTELELYREKLLAYSIKTIFIGGGTPSAIEGRYIYDLLVHLYKNFNLSKDMEITIEVNPGTIDKEKAKIYKEAGINRVSIGVQTFNNRLLKSIGRIHEVEQIYESYKLLRKEKIENINMDLIFGLPNQTLEDVLFSIEEAIRLGVEHISHYSLILEEGTQFYNLNKKGKLNLPDEDEERLMYHKATEYLVEKGYSHYEISNYALPGFECRHNLVYWDLLPYLGIGLGSHSYMENKRFFNTSNILNYIEKLGSKLLPIEGEEIINKSTEIEEYCILGLRKIKGIDKNEFKKRFNVEIEDIYGDVINKHIKNGLIIDDGRSIMLTKKGLDLSNLVEVDFLK